MDVDEWKWKLENNLIRLIWKKLKYEKSLW